MNTTRLGLIAALAFASLASACGSSSGGGNNGAIPCGADSPCPMGLECNLDEGVCFDPTGGGADPCALNPIPFCPCVDGQDEIDCFAGSDPAVSASCVKGTSTCDDDTKKYGECVAMPDTNCTSVGVDSGSFIPNGDNSSQVDVGPDGSIILDPDVMKKEFGFLWVANTGENTVSKLSIEDGKEVARYASVRDSVALGLHPVPLGGFNGDSGNCGNCPSRTAIDFNGDAFVANRAHSATAPNQASVTKYANVEDDCVDRSGNGAIETSTDMNGDGVIDKTDPAEFYGENDECILWTVAVGAANGNARALAIDAGGPDGGDGDVWVGLYGEQRAIQLQGSDGMPVTIGGNPVSVNLNDGRGMHPYGAAADGNGYVWFTSLSETGGPSTDATAYLAQVNVGTGTLVATHVIPDDDEGISQSYGISVDTKNRVWLAGYSANNLKMFDPATMQWYALDKDAFGTTRGIAPDAAGYIWVAFTGGTVGRYKIDDIIALGNAATGVEYILNAGGTGTPVPTNNTIGVGIDREGACWGISMNAGSPSGTATRIKDGVITHYPVGKDPYTYSDFTGFGLASVVRPQGFFRIVIEGCAADPKSEWRVLEWTEEEPMGTSVRLRVRVADTVAGLAAAPWYGPYETPPVDLEAEGIPPSTYMEIEVQLASDEEDVSPKFSGFDVTFECPGSIVD